MTTKRKMRAIVLFGMLAIVMSFGIQTAVGSLRQMLTVMTASPCAMTTLCYRRALAIMALAATGAHNDAADVSGDSVVTSLDALMILKAAAGG